jgi:hypothetical protein
MKKKSTSASFNLRVLIGLVCHVRCHPSSAGRCGLNLASPHRKRPRTRWRASRRWKAVRYAADEKLTAFSELESAIRASSRQNFHLLVNFKTRSMIFSLFFFDFAICT